MTFMYFSVFLLGFLICMYNYRTNNGNVRRNYSCGSSQNVNSMCHKKEPFWLCPTININDLLISSTPLITSLR